MNEALILLVITAASIGFFHTLTGPDHYLPFIVMSKARTWSYGKTIWITVLCGIGHVGSSIIIGLIGIATGIAVAKIEFIEGYRGNVAAWLFILFGLAYFIWGLWKAWKNNPHRHFHSHDEEDIVLHKHPHDHSHEKNQHQHPHPHPHETETHPHVHKAEPHPHVHGEKKKVNMTPWVLFTIFVFGPCEPLIPLLMYPAANESISGLIIVTLTFTIFTIGTMLGVVLLSLYGIHSFSMHRMERYMHAIAGGTILLCGLAIEFLGM